MITVFLGKALICIANICHPTLVGDTTPTGQYQIVQRFVEDEKFGEDVLKFHENDDSIFAIHRITKQRMKYMNNTPDVRNKITSGCINVTPDVYEIIVEHLKINNELKIEK